ncbi:bromodomain-containing protein 8 isoform X2 [Strongylocentrotus purpuratus]|uniref:Bromo domain-containing protein n=1 Tax=Strongylocentrotus purpuratus TaxID=7668 RepID=A0A7M7NTJ0_STRPU|nr:bromodomain-containing protein 8 isoform X2 [Strongylocentrotus purpuratus]
MATSAPMEQWSIREKLCLASSVMRSGDQNWVSVSRAIKPFIEPNRPLDWFSQKNCAIQYSAMLEAVDTPKRKRSGEKGEVETPVELLVRRMTQERIEDLRHQISDDRRKFKQLQEEIHNIQGGQLDDQLPKIWAEIQEKKRLEEEALENRRLAAEAKAAAAAAKLKLSLQSPNKKRPPIRLPKVPPPKPQTTPTPAEEDESAMDTEPIISVESSEPAADLDVEQVVQEDDQSQPELLSSLLTAQEEEEKNARKDGNQASEAVTIDEFTHIFSDSTKTPPSKETEKQKQLSTTKIKETPTLSKLLLPSPLSESGTTPDKEGADGAVDDSIEDEGEEIMREEKEKEKKDDVKKDDKKDNVEVPQEKQTEEPSAKTAGEKTTSEIIVVSSKPEAEGRKAESGGGKLLRSHHEPIDMEPVSPGALSKTEKKRGRGRPSNASRKSSRMRSKPDDDDDDTVMSFDDLKDETRSDAADSEDHDRPSESDDASVANLQSSLYCDSLPNSPSSVPHSEEDHAYRVWRKAIMLVWRAAASHKYASVFLHPVTEDIAPGYCSIVHQPLDLITIKKKIENGTIRTTESFHRYILIMFQNAIMYNSSDHDVHDMAVSMQNDVISFIEEFISTQLMVQQPDSSKSLRGRETMARRSEVSAPKDEELKARRSSTDHQETSGKKRRTRADEI